MVHDKKICILVTYNDLYDNNPDEVIKELFSYYPTALWKVSSYINSLLFADILVEQSQQVQFLQSNLRTRDCDCFKRLIKNGKEIEAKGNQWILFNRSSMLGVFKILIENMNTTTPIDDTQREFDEVFLKLVLIANQKRSNFEMAKNSFLNSNDIVFRQLRYIWPIRFAQIDNEDKIHVVYQSIRCLLLLKFVMKEAPNQFKSFQEEFGFKREYDYLGMIANPIEMCDVMKNKECSFFFRREEQSSKFYDSLCINKQDKDNFKISDIKFYPLFEHQENYFVTDWSYFGNQFYQGLWAQFRKRGITSKSELGNFFEKSLMKSVFQYIFKDADSLIFDEKQSIGIEDCYVRIGRKIFLFEFKDTLFPEDAIESFDFDTIKGKIDEGMILSKKGRKKALMQLCDNISNVFGGYYKYNDWGNIRLNSKSLEIYPIILYTDDKFRVEGLNYYLNERFNSIVNDKINHWKIEFKAYRHQIKSLTIVGLEFMLNNMVTLNKRPSMLFSMINEYHLKSRQSTKSDLIAGLKSFEKIFHEMDFVVPTDKIQILNILKDCDMI